MKNIGIAFVALTVVVALITLFIRIPLPSRGYFNFGDVAVVFSGLVLGSLAGMLGFFLDGLFQNNFGDTEVVMLFWLMTGLIVLQGKKLAAPGSSGA